MSGYRIRPYREGDLPAVAGFLSKLYRIPLELGREHTNWKLLENPYSRQPLVIIAECGGRIVGQYVYTPLRWRHSSSGSEETMPAPGGAFVSPDHRGQGLFRQMMEFGRDWLKQDYRWFLNTTSTSNSVHSYMKFGAHPLAPRSCLDSCTLPGLLHYCMNYKETMQPGIEYGRHGDILVSTEAMPEEMASVAGQRKPDRPAAEMKRDSLFYNWRYRNPARNYTFYYSGYPGAISGFMVVSHRGNNLRGRILDYGQSQEGALAKILRMIRRNNDFDILSVFEFCVDDDLAGALKAGRLKRRPLVRYLERKKVPAHPFFLIKTREGEQQWVWEGLDLRDIGNWSMMGAAREIE